MYRNSEKRSPKLPPAECGCCGWDWAVTALHRRLRRWSLHWRRLAVVQRALPTRNPPTPTVAGQYCLTADWCWGSTPLVAKSLDYETSLSLSTCQSSAAVCLYHNDTPTLTTVMLTHRQDFLWMPEIWKHAKCRIRQSILYATYYSHTTCIYCVSKRL